MEWCFVQILRLVIPALPASDEGLAVACGHPREGSATSFTSQAVSGPGAGRRGGHFPSPSRTDQHSLEGGAGRRSAVLAREHQATDAVMPARR